MKTSLRKLNYGDFFPFQPTHLSISSVEPKITAGLTSFKEGVTAINKIMLIFAAELNI